MNAPGTTPHQPARGRASERARSPQAEAHCDLCGQPASPHDFNRSAGLVICIRCTEDLLAEGANP